MNNDIKAYGNITNALDKLDEVIDLLIKAQDSGCVPSEGAEGLAKAVACLSEAEILAGNVQADWNL